jgi:putative transposase
LDRERLTREPPAVRFQAEHSNALWQFDISPSDLGSRAQRNRKPR